MNAHTSHALFDTDLDTMSTAANHLMLTVADGLRSVASWDDLSIAASRELASDLNMPARVAGTPADATPLTGTGAGHVICSLRRSSVASAAEGSSRLARITSPVRRAVRMPAATVAPFCGRT